MATQTLSNLGTALKQTYLGPIRDQLNNATVTYNRLEKHDEEVTGLDLTVQIPLFHGRNQGIGWRAEGGTLPTAGRRSHTKASLAMAYVYGQIKISGQAIKASRSNMGAFTKVVTNEVRGMVQGMKVEINRAMWGDGSGAMARITQATGSITAGDYFTVDDASRLENGMTFDTYAAKTGGSVVLDSKVISQVDVRNNKVSLTTTQTVTQNDYIFREDSRGLLMMGLEGIVDGADSAGSRIVSTHQGIARSTNIWWDGNVLDNGGTNRAISNTLVQQAFELGEIVGGGRCSLIQSGYDVRRAFIDLQLVDRRFAGMTTLDGGWRALEYTGGGETTPWVADRMGLKNRVFFLDESSLGIYRASDGFEWMDLDGAVMRKVADVDEYEATLFCYMNLGSTANNHNTVLRNVE